MDKFLSIAKHAGAWIQANPGWSSVIAVALLTMIINSLGKYPKANGVIGVLRKVVDMIQPWTHSESPGTWKPPLITLKRGDDGSLHFAPSFSIPPVPPPGPADQIKGYRQGGGFARMEAVLIVALLGLGYVFIFGGGCTAAQIAEWKTAGIDTATCTAPAVINAAGDAAVELVTDKLAGQTINDSTLSQIGVALVQKYGVPAFLCAIGKVWNDVGVPALAMHAQLSPLALRVQYLILHQQDIVKAAAAAPPVDVGRVQ